MVAADIGEQLVNEATDQSSRGVNPSDELRDDLQEERGQLETISAKSQMQQNSLESCVHDHKSILSFQINSYYSFMTVFHLG